MRQPRTVRSLTSKRFLITLIILVVYGLGWAVVALDKPTSLADHLRYTGLFGQPTITQDHPAASSANEVWRAEVLDVHDGDTLRIRSTVDQKVYKCRLIGIDTPELDGDTHILGKRARDLLRQEVAKAPEIWVSFDQERVDSYDRLLVYLWPTAPSQDFTQSINYRLVVQGYAEALKVKPNTLHAHELFNAEKHAHDERLGLWSEGDFTKRHRYTP